MRKIWILLLVVFLGLCGCAEVRTEADSGVRAEMAKDQRQRGVDSVSQIAEPYVSTVSKPKEVKQKAKTKKYLKRTSKRIAKRDEKSETNDSALVDQNNLTDNFQGFVRNSPAVITNTNEEIGGDIMPWWYVGFAGLVLLIAGISYRLGYGKALKDALSNQQRLEATKVWVENIGKFIGGMK